MAGSIIRGVYWMPVWLNFWGVYSLESEAMTYTSLTPEKRAQFLELLSEYGNVSRASEDSGLSRVYLYQLKREDPDFAAEWDEAARIGAARLEDEARKRAVEGWEEPVWHKGEMCGTVRKFSDTLLICLLKAHHPEKYRENIKQTVEGGDTPVSITFKWKGQ